MVVCSAADNTETVFLKLFCQAFRIYNNLGHDIMELLRCCIFEGPGLSGHSVEHQRAKASRESSFIKNFRIFLFTEYHTTSCRAEGFGCRRRYKVCIWNRARDDFCNKSCDVSHIYHEICTNFFSDLRDTLIVDQSGIRTCTCNNHLRFVLFCDLLQLIIINQLSLRIHTVEYMSVDFTYPVSW